MVKEVNVTVPVDVDVALDANVSGFGFKTFVPGSAKVIVCAAFDEM